MAVLLVLRPILWPHVAGFPHGVALCFVGMAPIRDSVSHSPNQTGDSHFFFLTMCCCLPFLFSKSPPVVKIKFMLFICLIKYLTTGGL